ncbi:recombination mediator RecR [Benzoatithermus flavus]|uniref:Recombination protein RecR n=1 Tax=Benzoatithermus flavus TaxID=3108223 RepID=A0ABU8XMU8_9PROT
MAAVEIDRLVRLLSRLPGLGPRSAQRAALAMLKRRDTLMLPLADALRACAEAVHPCSRCGNLDSTDPCGVCRDPQRDARTLCVVAEVEDLWAMERAGIFKGRYQVLGGTLRALDGIGPDELGVDRLLGRVREDEVREVILALGATVDGQTTSHYLAERLRPLGCTVSRLGHGVPIGGELTYLDEGTLDAALRSRQRVA